MRRSSTSFLVLLSSWIVLVWVIPRAGVLAAVERVPVPSVAQVESRKEGFGSHELDSHRRRLGQVWRESQQQIEAIPQDERADQEDERERSEIQNRIAENSRRINEEMRSMKTAQRRMGLTLSRVSPASIFQLVALDVSGTGLGLRDRYVDSINEYRNRFNSFVEDKGGNRMVVRAGGHDGDDDESGDDGFGDQGKPLDLLEFLGVSCFGVAFVAFLRYDVRP